MSNELVVQVKLEADPSSVEQTKSEFKGAFTGVTDEFAKTWDKLWSSSLDSTGKTIKTSLGSSVIEGITSGLDGIEDVWSKACTSLAGSLKKSLGESLGNLFSSSLGFGSASKGIGESIADYFAAKEMGDTTSQALVASGLAKEGSWAGSEVAGAGLSHHHSPLLLAAFRGALSCTAPAFLVNQCSQR